MLFALSRRVSSIPLHMRLDAAAVLDEIAEAKVESSDRFQEIDESLVIMFRALAEVARTPVS